MASATPQQLDRYLKHHWRRKALLVDDSHAVVEDQGKTAAAFGYEPLSDLLRSDSTKEWYQWWTRENAEGSRQ
jgi:hypothetical protein